MYTSDSEGLASKRSAEVEFKLAELWRTKGKIDRALDGFQRAIRCQPDYLPAYLELIQLFRHLDQGDQAIAWCRRAIDRHPGEPGLQQELEKLLLQQRGPQEQGSLPAEPKPLERSSLHLQGDKRGANLLLYTDCSDTFGVEQWNHGLLCGLTASGYSVTCAQGLAENRLVRQQQAVGVSHIWIPTHDLYDASRTPPVFSNWPEAEALFSACKPDLVIFSSGSPLSDLAAKEVAARLSIPYLIVVHCVTSSWSRQFDPVIERLRRIHEEARAVVTVSRNNFEMLRRYFCLAEEKGEVIINGVGRRFFEAAELGNRLRLRRELGIAEDDVVVLTVARLAQTKGYQFLLEAAALLRQRPVWPRLKFVWAGSGSFESRLRVVAGALGVADKIQFLGERADIPELLEMADIFALTSQFEGMPLAVMEAMAKGLPVMAADVGGVADQMGETGKLLPPAGQNPRPMIKAVASTLETWAGDENLRHRIGQEARKRAATLFREEQMLEKYKGLIERSLA